MTFANPMAFALLALAGPIILLYMLRQRRRPVQVATLQFWDDILSERRSAFARTNLRRWLSLLLQLLFLLLVTLAAAQPVFSTGGLGAQRVVILLDTSVSMLVEEEGGTRWDEAVRHARGTIASIAMADTAALVAVGREPYVAASFTNSRRQLRGALDALSPTHGRADFESAFALVSALPEDPRPTTVVVISDGAFDPIAAALPEWAHLAFLPVGERTDNAGITAFSARLLPGSTEDFEIFLEAVNHGDETVVAPFDIQVDGRLVDAGELVLPPGEPVTRTARHLTRTGGVVTATLEADDALAIDNRAYALLPPIEPVRVLLVRGEHGFVQNALATDSLVALTVTTPEDYPLAVTSTRHEVVVFDGEAPGPAPDRHALYIGAVPPGAAPAGVILEVDGTVDAPFVTEWDRAHPVTRGLSLGNVTVDRAMRFAAHEGYETLVESLDGPLVLYRRDEAAATLIIGFSALASDLPLRAAFPMLISNAVRHLTRPTQESYTPPDAAGTLTTRAMLAARLAPSQAARLPLDTPWQVWTPGARAETAVPLGDGDALPLDTTGIYGVLPPGGERPIPVAAVNLSDPRASDITPSDTLPLAREHPAMADAPTRRLAMDPLALLVLLALVLSTAEWVLYHRRWVE